jgi:hypothetical protein
MIVADMRSIGRSLPLPNMRMGRAKFVPFIFASNSAMLLRKLCQKFLAPPALRLQPQPRSIAV